VSKGVVTWMSRCWRAGVVLLCLIVAGGSALAQTGGGRSEDEFDDAHFHLTNYVQKGTEVRDFLRMMGSRTRRSTLFGIPLQQTWSYENSGDFAPTYYLQTDAPL
jgi:hypothetical protein